MTSKCGYKKMGSAASCHNCKVWAHPLPSSLPELPQNSHGASPGKAHAHVSLLAGNERAFLLRTCVMATGCLHQRRSKCTQETLVSSGFGGREEKEYCLVYTTCLGQFWVQTNLSRKPQWHRHTMHSLHYCGTPTTHATWWGRFTMDECQLFTVFLTAFDFNTSASLTTTISQTFYCVLGMQTTWGKMGNDIS